MSQSETPYLEPTQFELPPSPVTPPPAPPLSRVKLVVGPPPQTGPITRNTELFDKIADHIELHPEDYCQTHWGPSLSCVAKLIPDFHGGCGSAYCVAGTAIHMSGGDISGYAKENVYKGRVLLGLTEQEAKDLFDGGWKPPEGESVPDALRRIGRGGSIT